MRLLPVRRLVRKTIDRTSREASKLVQVHTDSVTGFPYENCFGHRVFIKRRADHQLERFYAWLCQDIYFKNYLPTGDDLVVDVGAGYGHEALYVHNTAPGVRYIGVEAQPVIYECLANTFAPFNPQLIASPYAITSGTTMKVTSQANYTVGAADSDGVIEVPTQSWAQFVKRHDIDRVALLKVNIEGGERLLIRDVDLTCVDRIIVSAHDFRADAGHGEQFRTRDDVYGLLRGAGFDCSPIGDGDWYRDWIYGESPSLATA